MQLRTLSIPMLIGCIISLYGCGPIKEVNNEMNPSPTMWMGWKTVATASDATGQRVDVLLMLSGTMNDEIQIGTFYGEPLAEPLVRDWWAGTEEILYLRRKDETHLTIEREPLNDLSPVSQILLLTIPKDTVVDCVDNERCA